MFDRDLGKGAFAGSLFRRHGRMILMSVAAVVIVGGLVQGAFVPKPLDFGVVTALIVRRFFIVSALIVRRFGLMRTSVTALVLSLSANVRETRSTQRIRVGRRQRNGPCWDCERE